MFSGLPGPDADDDDGVLRAAVVLGVLVVLGDQAGLDQPGHVGLERQVHEVGGQAGLDRARLVARGPERVLEGDVGALVGLGEPGLQVLDVGGLRGRVGDQVDRAAAAVAAAAGGFVEEPPQAATPRASATLAAPAASMRASPRGRASARTAFAAPSRRSFCGKRVMSFLVTFLDWIT